ncbi:MAG: MerR family transcriptional regulator, partial [Chloroflexota bacterium]
PIMQNEAKGEIIVKIGEVADQLGVTTQTLRNWVKRPALSPLFSPGANGVPGNPADFTESDFILLNSVRVLMDRDKGAWDKVEALLVDGWRETLLPERAAVVAVNNNAAMQLAARAQSADDQRIALTERVAGLERRLSAEQDRHRDDVERLAREIGDAKGELAEANLLLKLYRKRGRIDGDDGKA